MEEPHDEYDAAAALHQVGQFVKYNRSIHSDGIAAQHTGFGRIMKKSELGVLHIQIFFTSHDTCLGDYGDESELYSSSQCADIEGQDVLKVFNVNGQMDGAKESLNFHCKLRYNPRDLSFLYDPLLYGTEKGNCILCEERRSSQLSFNLTRSMLSLSRPSVLRIGDDILQEGVFIVLKKDLVGSSWFQTVAAERFVNRVRPDDKTYPEMWRVPPTTKFQRTPKMKLQTVCRIVSFVVDDLAGARQRKQQIAPDVVTLKVQIFARKTDLGVPLGSPHEVVQTNHFVEISGCQVDKVVEVHHDSAHQSIEDWILRGLSSGKPRFHFALQFDQRTRKCSPTGLLANITPSLPSCQKLPKLSSLDLFSGCGGMSLGLEWSDLAQCKWAVEKDEDAAAAFAKNFPHSKVYVEDAAVWFSKVKVEAGYPRPGEVDVICGGPPCQGFSGMNRYRESSASEMKRSLTQLYFEICVYLKPRYLIFENVAAFVLDKSGQYAQEAVAFLLRNNYQVRIGVLRAAGYGVPQSRRRTFIVAAAQNEKLPPFPLETYSLSANPPSYNIGTKKLKTPSRGACLYPPCSVGDAIGDLHDVVPDTLGLADYVTSCQSLLQHKLRADSTMVSRHQQVYRLTELDKGRMRHIPEGGDWRNLPNFELLGVSGKLLSHCLSYRGTRSKKSLVDCTCTRKIKCKRLKRAPTTIPWCLAHSASKNNHWRGAFGRLETKGLFATMLTKLSPLKANGRIVHPKVDRYITIREAARGQTFPDKFHFHGNNESVMRQIGNGVPPLLAEAVGCALKRHMKSTNHPIGKI